VNSLKLKELIKIKIKPFWSQMDALGHLNNSVYFTFCEQARIEWFERIGLVKSVLGKSKNGPVVIHASCTFLKPVVYPCDLSISMNSEEPGRSSILTHYEIYDSQYLYATGSSKIVWIDFEKGKSVTIPDEIRKHLII
jgi:acyl-CoA thioester hydrolase